MAVNIGDRQPAATLPAATTVQAARTNPPRAPLRGRPEPSPLTRYGQAAPHLQVLRHQRRRAPGRGAAAVLLLGLRGRALQLVLLLLLLVVLLLLLLVVATACLRQQLLAPPARLG